MRESPEVAAVVTAFVEAIRAGDGDAVLVLHSRDPALEIVGTDEDEWALRLEQFELYVRERGGGYDVDVFELRAYEEGDVGWFALRFAFLGREGTPARMTGVLRREGGEWRFVQRHVSIGRA